MTVRPYPVRARHVQVQNDLPAEKLRLRVGVERHEHATYTCLVENVTEPSEGKATVVGTEQEPVDL